MVFKDYIRNEIKSMIASKGMTMLEVVDAINKKYDKKDTIQNLSAKLSRGTIKYSEVLEIADVLDYKIEWRHRDPRNYYS